MPDRFAKDSMRFSRREFLVAGAIGAAGIAAFQYYTDPSLPRVPTFIRGGASKSGHLLRQKDFPAPSSSRNVGVVIIGGGISGLSAAWRLKKKGFRDLVVLELEARAGGNSQSGKNAISAYPWGAHYLPVPGHEAEYVKELLEEIGVITGRDSNGMPIYDELSLCSAPQERLHIQGRWQEGTLPEVGIAKADRDDYAKFFAFIDEMKCARGADGKRAFSIPADLSSADDRFLAYDRISMNELLSQMKITSDYLRWHLTYCYRDDFGMGPDRISAWAGIHYFAARRSESTGGAESNVLTWPEGNGFLVRKLLDRVGDVVVSGAVTYSVQNFSTAAGPRVRVRYLDANSGAAQELIAHSVVYSAPRFTAPYVIEDLKGHKPEYLSRLQYVPWMVANISLGAVTPGQKQVDKPAWDNVFYGGESLGYVVATHQSLKRSTGETVLTYYMPLSFGEPSEQRKMAQGTTAEEWRERILGELLRFQPELRSRIQQIEVWIWGHAMRVPAPGAIWGADRAAMRAPVGRVHFAHSDMSGFSIFEEAQYHGVVAADAVLLEL